MKTRPSLGELILAVSSNRRNAEAVAAVADLLEFGHIKSPVKYRRKRK